MKAVSVRIANYRLKIETQCRSTRNMKQMGRDPIPKKTQPELPHQHVNIPQLTSGMKLPIGNVINQHRIVCATVRIGSNSCSLLLASEPNGPARVSPSSLVNPLAIMRSSSRSFFSADISFVLAALPTCGTYWMCLYFFRGLFYPSSVVQLLTELGLRTSSAPAF